jgi:hypothetical protein
VVSIEPNRLKSEKVARICIFLSFFRIRIDTIRFEYRIFIIFILFFKIEFRHALNIVFFVNKNDRIFNLVREKIIIIITVRIQSLINIKKMQKIRVRLKDFNQSTVRYSILRY